MSSDLTEFEFFMLVDSQGREYTIAARSPIHIYVLMLFIKVNVKIFSPTPLEDAGLMMHRRGLVGPQLSRWIDDSLDDLVESAKSIRLGVSGDLLPVSEWDKHPLFAAVMRIGYWLDTQARRKRDFDRSQKPRFVSSN